MKLRRATPADFDALGQVMYDAIHAPGSPYTEAQRHAWLSAPPSGTAWHEKLAGQIVITAETGGALIGMMTLTPTGYIDLAFILPQGRGTGLFARMLAQIEDAAHKARMAELTTHASLAAIPAFTRSGFDITAREEIPRGNETLRRAAMRKRL